MPLGVGCLLWLRHVLDAEADTRGTRRAAVDWNDFLSDPRRSLERVREQLGVVWPKWSNGVLAEIDEFVSADMRRQRASDSDLEVHPAVSDLIREAYAAVRELVEDPASENVERTLADIRERFDGASAIFGYPMLELEKGTRRAQSAAVALRAEYATELASAREEFAREASEASSQVSEALRQVSEASSQLADARAEFARELTEARTEFARELAQARREFGIRVGEAREEFAVRLSETQSESQRLANEATRSIARAEDIVAHVGQRYGRRSALNSRFRDYFRPRQKERRELTAIGNSAFFDREFYLDSNSDVRTSGMDAALHYLIYGGREGRDPGPFFSTHEYLVRFPDVAASGVNALAHYEMYGRREMRKVPLTTR
jgi:hypothetical protein